MKDENTDMDIYDRSDIERCCRGTNKGCGRKIGWLPCCTVINADSEEYLWTLPAGCVDLVVTDPPYGMSYKSGQEHHGTIHWDDEFPTGNLQVIVAKSCPICGGGSQLARLATYCFCRWDNLRDPSLLSPRSALVWDKQREGGAGNTANEHARNYEMVLFYPGPEHKFKRRPASILRCPPSGNLAHPTQKPVKLIQKIFEWYDFETVLDPYMGSGTTAIAAKEKGKHFLGFEINRQYYERSLQLIAEIGE